MSNTTDETVQILAANIGTGSIFPLAFNLDKAAELIEADAALPEAERQVAQTTLQAVADAVNGHKTHWSTIGRALNALDDLLPPPTPVDEF